MNGVYKEMGMKDSLKKIPFISSNIDILRKIKSYSKKTNTNIIKVALMAEIYEADVSEILKKVKIKNIGIEPFYNTLDDKVVIHNACRIIDNIPIDYSVLFKVDLSKADIKNDIVSYMQRVNDSRINLNNPLTLFDALQTILFWNSLIWQTGHKLVGLGRLDKVLKDFEIPNDAEDLICSFLKNLHCKYEFKSNNLLGDTGQIIILGGLDEDGSYFCNEYTYLFIKCLKKLNLPDPKILLRCSANMPENLMNLAVECVATGIGSPIFSNDDVVIPKLMDFGYEKKDAYNYGVSACWEPLSIGNSLEQNNLANIEYGKCINEAILDSRFLTCRSFEEVLSLFYEKLERNCEAICLELNNIQWEKDPLLTFLFGLNQDISEGGAKYNNYGILSVGMSSAVNSLLNIKEKVFELSEYSLQEIQNIILDNYVKDIEKFSENKSGFGVDCDESIKLTNEIIFETEKHFKDYRNKFGGKVKFGLSSPSYIDISHNVGATLDGRKANEPFQTHISRDKGEPLTEIMNFESKLHFSGISSNANVIDVMVPGSLIKENIDKFSTYMMGGIKEGIFQLQMNVLSYKQLVEAKLHPEKYPNLIVRVWGFSAYFNDLPEEYKDNLIKRAKEMEKIA